MPTKKEILPGVRSSNVVKRGSRTGANVWCRSCDCNSGARREAIMRLWNGYVFRSRRSENWRRDRIRQEDDIQYWRVVLPEKKHEPRPIHLVVDATYFGTRIDKLMGSDPFPRRDRKNLWWKYVSHETADDYREGKDFSNDWDTSSLVTSDGFLGLQGFWAHSVPDVPVPHEADRGQERDHAPITEAGKSFWPWQTLSRKRRDEFLRRLQAFHVNTSSSFPRRHHPDGSKSWTHEGARRAYMSLLIGGNISSHIKRILACKHDQYLRRPLLAHQRHRPHPSRLCRSFKQKS